MKTCRAPVSLAAWTARRITERATPRPRNCLSVPTCSTCASSPSWYSSQLPASWPSTRVAKNRAPATRSYLPCCSANKEGYVFRQVRVLPVYLLEERSHDSERDLLHRPIGVPVGISPLRHGDLARRGETESLERRCDALGLPLIPQDDQSMLVPGSSEDPLPRFDQRLSRRVNQPGIRKEEVRVVALPVLLVQVRDAELEPLQTCAESFEPSSLELEGTRQFVHAARVTRGHGKCAQEPSTNLSDHHQVETVGEPPTSDGLETTRPRGPDGPRCARSRGGQLPLKQTVLYPSTRRYCSR